MNYDEWAAQVPQEITDDALWTVEAYRLGLFVADVGWYDVTRLMRDRRTHNLAGQLYRALGSIGANLAEGYSRGTGKDRARFYEYALGSARESRDWYYMAWVNPSIRRYWIPYSETPHYHKRITDHASRVP